MNKPSISTEKALHHARSPFSYFVVIDIKGAILACAATQDAADATALALPASFVVNAYDLARPLAAPYAAALMAAVAAAPTIAAVMRLHGEFAELGAAVSTAEDKAITKAIRARVLALSPARPAKAK